MKGKILMAGMCVALCLLAGCRQSGEAGTASYDKETDEVNVASNISDVNAFSDDGYYHSDIHSVSYIDQQHQADKKKIVYSDDNGVYSIMHHQGKLYILATGQDFSADSSVWTINRWDPDQKKEECLKKIIEDGMVFSMAAAGDTLYYTYATSEGSLTVDGITYDYGKAQLWAVDLNTGNEKKLLELEGSEDMNSNALIITEGDYKNSDSLLVRYRYIVRNESDMMQAYTDFYKLDLHTQKTEQNKKLQLQCDVDLAYLRKNEFYYFQNNGEKTDYNYMNMETGEITTVLTAEMFGLFLPEYISFVAAGEDPRHCLYYYEDGRLLVSKKFPVPNIIAAKGKYAALEENVHSEDSTDEENPNIYTIVENDAYLQENYKEYDGESPDILKYYGRMGTADNISEDVTEE